ncbi:hypothetical protein BSKO_02599 [Bryopsis sp. KO-2023]|nr:hypothetical protein BSKO_02599 [Bryopsis sp. KO-2023]
MADEDVQPTNIVGGVMGDDLTLDDIPFESDLFESERIEENRGEKSLKNPINLGIQNKKNLKKRIPKKKMELPPLSSFRLSGNKEIDEKFLRLWERHLDLWEEEKKEKKNESTDNLEKCAGDVVRVLVKECVMDPDFSDGFGLLSEPEHVFDEVAKRIMDLGFDLQRLRDWWALEQKKKQKQNQLGGFHLFLQIKMRKMSQLGLQIVSTFFEQHDKVLLILKPRKRQEKASSDEILRHNEWCTAMMTDLRYRDADTIGGARGFVKALESVFEHGKLSLPKFAFASLKIRLALEEGMGKTTLGVGQELRPLIFNEIRTIKTELNTRVSHFTMTGTDLDYSPAGEAIVP